MTSRVFAHSVLLALLALVSPAASTDNASAAMADQATHQAQMTFTMNPLTWSYFIRTPRARHLHLSFRVEGDGATNVRAARVIIDHATDDTGKELRNETPPKFYHAAVGRTSTAELHGPIPPSIEATLTEVAPEATAIKELRGRVHLVVPAMTPDATVIVDHLESRLGSRIETASLSRAHVTLHVFGPGQSAAAADAAHIKNISLAEQYLPAAELAKMPATQREQLLRRPVGEIGDCEVLLAVSDPEDRLVGVEFVAADGSPLVYNRNGVSHLDHQGWRFSTYRLDCPASAGIKLVCWLALDSAIAEIPLIMNDVPLPPWPTAPATPTPAAH